MTSYVNKLLSERESRSDLELAWELEEALNEKRSRAETLTSSEQLAWHVCTVAHCDGIEEILVSARESIEVAADFARKHGLQKTAEILSNAAMGVAVGSKVSLVATILGKKIPIPMPEGKWAATDLALSAIDEDMDGAVMDFVAANIEDFMVPPSAAAACKDALAMQVAQLASGRNPLDLFRELLAHRNPRIRAQLSEYERTGKVSDWLEIEVIHRAEKPAGAQKIAQMKQQYGSAATSLLELYAAHNGADLFVAEGNAGFILLPIEDWPGHMAEVMTWARDVTWNDAPEEIPEYLESSIPFGYIPGDSERWLLVTQGRHAGKLMLSDTDVADDQPRYESLSEFFAAMILDIDRIVGCGGYNSYGHGKQEGMYYPREYLY